MITPAILYLFYFTIRRVWILVYLLDYSPKKIDFDILSPRNMSSENKRNDFFLTFVITLLVFFFSAISGAVGSAIYQAPEDSEIFTSLQSSFNWFIDTTRNSSGGLTLIGLLVVALEIIGLIIYSILDWLSNRKNDILLDELYGSFQTGEKDPKLFGTEYREGLKKNLDAIYKAHPAYKEMSSVKKRLHRIDSLRTDRSRIFLIILYLAFFATIYTESNRFENGFTQAISALTYILLCIFFIMLDPCISRSIQEKKKEYLLYAYRKISARRDYIEKALNQ